MNTLFFIKILTIVLEIICAWGQLSQCTLSPLADISGYPFDIKSLAIRAIRIIAVRYDRAGHGPLLKITRQQRSK